MEPEFKKDLEGKIFSLEHRVKNYKKYYDWYFKVYHLEPKSPEDQSIISKLHNAIGYPEDIKEKVKP